MRIELRARTVCGQFFAEVICFHGYDDQHGHCLYSELMPAEPFAAREGLELMYDLIKHTLRCPIEERCAGWLGNRGE